MSPTRLELPTFLAIRHLQELFDSLLLAATFYAAIGLLVGKRYAWYVAIVILSLSLGWEVLKVREGYFSLPVILVAAALVLTILNHRLYSLRTDVNFVKPLRIAFIFTVVTTAVSCLAYFIVSAQHHQHFTFITRLLHSLDAMYSLEFFTFRPMTHHFESTMSAFLGYVGVINYAAIAFAITGPIVDRTRTNHIERQRVWQLLSLYSRSSEDYFKYWPQDKNYLLSPSTPGFVAYKTQGNNSIALADPIAPTATIQQELIKAFEDMAKVNGWRPVFLHVLQDSHHLYADTGFTLLKIGENATVNCQKFTDETVKNKNFRNIRNRFNKKHHATITIHHPPHSHELLRKLEHVSGEWLAQNGREERAFAMGYYDPSYLNQSRVACLYDEAHSIIAWVSMQPNFSRTQASIDLIRTTHSAPSNTVDFILSELILKATEEGFTTFDLGLAPLSGLQNRKNPEEIVMHAIYAYTSRWFAFEGLRRFKDKFEPEWKPSYLAYKGPRTSLPSIAISLNQLLESDIEEHSDYQL